MAAGRDVLAAGTRSRPEAAGPSIDDMVLEKLFDVFHPETREGKASPESPVTGFASDGDDVADGV